ncbi:MAG: hypothetical protein ABII18_11240 [bacterium]|nr:hypothetical protein [bacterium]MBU1918779.1 hypothetical protein [bacterium]
MIAKLLTVMTCTIFLCVTFYVTPVRAGNPQPIITEPVFLGGANPEYYKNKKKPSTTDTQEVTADKTIEPVVSKPTEPSVVTTIELEAITTQPEVVTTQTTIAEPSDTTKETENSASIGIGNEETVPTTQKPVEETKPVDSSNYDF